VVPVLVIAAAQRAPRRRPITFALVRHVITGARDVIVAAGRRDPAAAEVDRWQVVVDGAEMSELDVGLGDALTAARQIRQTIVGNYTHTHFINIFTSKCYRHRKTSQPVVMQAS